MCCNLTTEVLGFNDQPLNQSQWIYAENDCHAKGQLRVKTAAAGAAAAAEGVDCLEVNAVVVTCHMVRGTAALLASCEGLGHCRRVVMVSALRKWCCTPVAMWW